jgi:flavodoxin I
MIILEMKIIITKGGIHMKNVTVIYWSGTGNTEMMAEAIKEGAIAAGSTVKLLQVEDATTADIVEADAIALGCPSMGAEALEETYMEPFVSSLAGVDFSNKTVGLFGSYGWGDGQWMRDWVEQMKGFGVDLINDGLIIQGAPSADGLAECKTLGTLLAK